MAIASPRPASTVALLRPGPGGLEVFLVRRHAGIAFMGGAHVFPGGRVEPGDADERLAALAEGVDTGCARLADVGRAQALAFHVAAARETFEEAGVLLARRDGAFVSFPAAGEPDVEAWRASLADGRTSLVDLLQRHDWRLALDALAYFAHWVTPPIETRRFDTRFFLTIVPPQQEAAHDRREMTDGFWISPADAIARCRRGDLALPPPTWTTLRWLEAFDRVETAMAWARTRPVPRIEPVVVEDGGSRIVLLPGDEDLRPVDGFEARETRFRLSDGRWTPVTR